MDYVIISLNVLLILLHFFRVIHVVFKPKLLTHKIFQFPADKYSITGYYLCAMVLMMMVILMRLDLF